MHSNYHLRVYKCEVKVGKGVCLYSTIADMFISTKRGFDNVF